MNIEAPVHRQQDALDLLETLSSRDIRLSLHENGSDLVFDAPSGAFDDYLKVQTRALKHEIVEILRNGTDQPRTAGHHQETGPVIASFPAHPAIEGQWLARRDLPAHDDYQIATRFRLPAETGFDALKQALERIIARSDALRSTFVEQDGQLVQRVHEHMPIPIARITRFDEIQGAPFDLGTGPLARFGYMESSDTRPPHLAIVVDHLCFDGQSFALLRKELLEELAGRTLRTPTSSESLSRRAHRDLAGTRGNVAAEFWQQRHEKLLDAGLPSDPLAGQDDQAKRLLRELTSEQLEALERLSAYASKATQTALWSALAIAVLARHKANGTACLGLPFSGRADHDSLHALGCFANVLPLAITPDMEAGFDALLQQVGREILSIMDVQDYPLSRLAQDLSKQTQGPASLPFDAVSIIEIHEDVETIDDIDVGAGKFPLLIALVKCGSGTYLAVEHQTAVFSTEWTERFADRFLTFACALAEDPAQAIGDVDLLPPAEKRRLLTDFNATDSDYPRDLGVGELLARHIRNPASADRVALDDGQTRLTYRELGVRLAAISAELEDAGVRAGQTVGLAAARGLEGIIAMLGLTWHGAAYLPVDRSLPANAVAGLMDECGAGVLLCDPEERDRLSELADRFLLAPLPKGDGRSRDGRPGEVVPAKRAGSDLAYVMFTSGSTGKPKGVLVPNRAVARLVLNNPTLPFGPDEVIAQAASLGFDASTLEIWAALLNGGELQVLDDDTLFDPHALKDALDQRGVTTLWLTASLFNRIADDLPTAFASLKRLMTGGEALSPLHVGKVMQACPDLTLINGYGPTENTTFTCTHRIAEQDISSGNIPIGRPIGNTRVYILDGRGQVAPTDSWGELHAAGDGLALGYSGAPERTARSFVQFGNLAEARLYKTGDRARWRDDGTIEFGGRGDGQVKIRGHRIELAAVEQRFSALEGVRNICVMPIGTGAEAVLGAAIAADRDTRDAWTAAVSRDLPDYMIPDRIVVLDHLPVTANGKVDRKTLQSMMASAEERIRHPARTNSSSEQLVITLFQSLFAGDEITPASDFFALGGHSLIAMRLAGLIEKETGFRPRIQDIFSARTVAKLAELVDDHRGITAADSLPRANGERFPLSSGQARLWVLQRMQPELAVYSVPATLQIEGPLDADALQRALSALELRQHALRLRFKSDPEHPDGVIQYLASGGDWTLHRHRMDESSARSFIAQEAARPFELDDAPMARADLITLAADRHWLMISLHHAICDGWSMPILLQELAALYEAEKGGEAVTLPDLERHYEDFASWQQDYLKSDAGKAALERWKERLAPLPEPLDLPTDRPRGAERRFAGGFHDFAFDAETTRLIEEAAVRHGTTAFTILTSLVQLLLHRHCGQNDIPLGMLVAGREHSALDNVIGFFVNTVLVRQTVDPQAPFEEHLAATSKTVMDALSDQSVPFEEIVSAVNAPRALSRNPLFDVLVAWQDGIPEMGRFGDAELSLVDNEFPFAKFDLAFYFWRRHDHLQGQVEFDSDLFDRETIEALIGRLTILCRAALAAAEETPVSRLAMMPEAERLLVDQFNATTQDLPIERSIPEPFLDQVRKTPDAVALTDGQETLTYRQFARRASGIAAKLAARSVKPGEVVGVAVRRSIDMLVAIHGVLLAGAAYSPLDPDHPEQRRRDMLDDLGDGLVITTSDLVGLFDEGRTLVIDGREDADVPDLVGGPDDLAYVLFTSGSTGRPKGVEIAHRGVLNRILWMQDTFPIGTDDVILQKTPITFDVSVWELFWWSWTGAGLVLPPLGAERDPQQLAETICDNGVTTLHFVPSMLASFLFAIESGMVDVDKLSSLRRVFASGEALDAALVQRFNSLLFDRFGTQLHNLYGPTEATVDVTWQACSPHTTGNVVPIGKPIANTTVQILTQELEPQPVGVAGEIVLGGPQVALGYRNRPELSAEKFPEDPRNSGQRLYRTGDLGRWRHDGTVEYLGRIDDQVKIRGFRIECGEVEAALESHPSVERAPVKAVKVGGLDELHAFILANEDLGLPALRDHLRERLPDYMIPARFFGIAHLPLTSSGKIDRKALAGTPLAASKGLGTVPAKSKTAPAADTAPQAGLLEAQLMQLWQEVLPDVTPAREDGFFDVGGNSLLLLRLFEKIDACWPGKLRIADLFANPSIARQAELLVDQKMVSQTPHRSRAAEPHVAKDEPIAVIGMAVQLAGTQDIGSFWQAIAEGRDHVRSLPASREADTRAFLAAIGMKPPNRFREAAYLDSIFDFDAQRFRMAPTDASLLDPEQRLFMETALMALEDAGYGGNALRGQGVGVFAGGAANPAWRLAMEHVAAGKAEQAFALNVPSNIVTRLSYLKDWHGPASVVDTACSSSLVAIHHACLSLRDGSSRVAIVGGAKVLPCPPDAESGFTIDSSTARTRAFDAEADGTGVGEGSAVFVLKPLGAAVRDGDHVHAVIRGSSVNQDGASSGAAAPNPMLQAEVIRQAAVSADVDLSSLSYFEAHGTGTSLGDPIEIDGLTRAFEECDRMPVPAFVGSGKGNYGHLDGAAGALGLARAILALRHDHAPPQPFFDRPNPKIDFDRAPVRVSRRLEKLPDRGQPRRAGVSSFGLSGINAHMVVEAAPGSIAVDDAHADASANYVVALSAGSEEALRDYAAKLHHRILGDNGLAVRDIAFTLATGRDDLTYRFAVAVQTRDELLECLAQLVDGGRPASPAASQGARQAIEACAATAAEAQRHVDRYLDGAPLSWPDSRQARRVSLPPAPFVKKACKPDFKLGSRTAAALLQGPLETEAAQIFSISVSDPAFWPVSEHRLNGHPALVGMAVPALIAQAVKQLDARSWPVQVTDLAWRHPLVASAVPDGKVTLSIFNDGLVELAGRLRNGKWCVFARARWNRSIAPSDSPGPDLACIRASATVAVPLEGFTGHFGPIALSERWDCSLSVYCNPERTAAVKHLRLDEKYLSDLEDWVFHPALADAACSMALAEEPAGSLPVAVDQVTVHGRASAEVLACGQRHPSGTVDVTLFDAGSHEPVLTVTGLRFDRAEGAEKAGSPAPLKTQWQTKPVTVQDIPAGCLFITDGDFWPVPDTCQRLHPDDLDRVGLAATSHAVLALHPGSDSARRNADALRAVLRNMNGGLRLVTLGCGAFQMDGDDIAVAPDQSATAGVVLAVAHEEPRLEASYADMTPEAVQSCLGAELSLKPSQDPICLYRNGRQRFVRKLLPLVEADHRDAAAWPDHGVCVVSGGSGGFAMALAEEMAADGKVQLALLGRRGEAGLDEDTRGDLERLRGKGIELTLFCCDVADDTALDETLDRIRSELGPITAVVHAAGIADGGFLALRDMTQFDAVLSAKVTGALNLDRLTRSDPLQAFVMFGSLTAIVGAPGQAAYCAANAFLDGFAHHRRSQGRPALTIDWCALSEQGMAARNNVQMHEGAWVSPADAVKLWQTALRSSATQLTMLDPSLLEGTVEAAHETGSQAVPSEAKPAPAVEQDVEGRIAKIWAAALGYDSVSPEDDFFALGGDSITGMQIMDEINTELSVSLTLSDLFTTPTVAAVAARAEREAAQGGKGDEAAAESPGTGDAQAMDLERALSAIWAETLGYDAVDPDEDFYALGGDSITAMQIADRISSELGHEVSLTDLFQHSSIWKLHEKLSPPDVAKRSVGERLSTGVSESPVLASATAPPSEDQDPRRAPDLPSYPLALEQMSVMNAAQKGNMGTAFNLPHAFVLEEAGRLDGLRAAIRCLTERHEILRTRFTPKGDSWQMEVLPVAQAIGDLPVNQVSEPVEEACAAWVEPFDLENEIPVRWSILVDPFGKTALFFDIHHILADAFTVERLLGELFALYCGEDLPPLRYQLRDYAWWSRTEENRQRLAAAKSYWHSLYADSVPKIDLPSDRRRPAFHTFEGGIVGFELDPEILAEARRFAAGQRVTMFTLVLTTWFVVLSRLAETEDLVISVPVDARDASGFRDVAGMMVSLLPLRMQIAGTETVKDLLARMQDHHVHALRHRAYFLDQLLEDLSLPAAPDRTLLSEVSLSYINYQAANSRSDGSDPAPQVLGLDRRHSKNDIGIFVRDLPEKMAITFDYYADLFDRARIEQLGQVFSSTLQRLIRSDAQQVGAIDLLPEDQDKCLRDWENGPLAEVPEDVSLFGVFASTASSAPERCAVRDSAGAWTYGQLMAEARAIACHLTANGIKQGDFVALHVERGRQAIAATLGIAALGAGYVPLDPAYPAERNRFILQDSGASIALVDDEGKAALADTAAHGTQVCHLSDIPPADDDFELPLLQSPQTAPAYLMYTSGSTGAPKGVLIEQGAVLRLALGEDYAGIAPGEVVAQAGPLSFDAATFEIWATLLRGAEIAVIDRHTLLDPAAFGAALGNFAVSRMFMSVGLFNRQIDHDPRSLSGLKLLMIGGDSYSKSHVRAFMKLCPDTELLNAYGPTESTTFAVVTRILPSDLKGDTESTIIGRPIAHTRTVIRDARGLRTPVGVWGELQIGGDRLAREYWRQPELTAERFVPDPDRAGARLYRTGDFARWTRDGRIEFGGRRDNQIKLRGFRIELDEIEQQLRQAPSVKNAVALFNREGLNGGEILACIQGTEKSGTTADQDLTALQAWLGQHLPAYMVPTKWYQVDDIPLTENGKLDRKALLNRLDAQHQVELQDGDAVPLSPAEQLVADIFSEVFGTAVRSRDASFATLGGHSLMAIRIVNRIADRAGNRISMADFFANPSVAALARHVDGLAKEGTSSENSFIPTAPKLDAYPASHAQKRLYLLSQMDGNNRAYGMLFALRCSGALHSDVLETALRNLVERHEPLRTAFLEHDGDITQCIHPTTTPEVVFTDVSDCPEPAREALRLTREEAATPVALDSPPLIRARLIKLGSNEHLLILATHHIVGDGWSSRILLRELGALYQAALRDEAPTLAPLPITYKDFAHWQAEQDWSEAADYWRETLKGAPEQIALPMDRRVPEIQSYRGAHAHLTLDPEVLRGLHALARSHNTTLSAVGLALFSAMLYRLTRQEDMVIGMGVAGREKTQTEGLIGFFVNVLPIRVQLDEETDLGALIDEVHRSITAALDRQDYPFDELVRAVAPKRKGNRQPLVNVVFEYQRFEALARIEADDGLPLLSRDQEGLLPTNLDSFVDNATAKHDLILFLTEEADQARFTLEYDTDLFEAQTMQRWLTFLNKFASAAADSFPRDD